MTIVTDKKVVAGFLFVLLVIFLYIGYYSGEEELLENSVEHNDDLALEAGTGQIDVKISDSVKEDKEKVDISSEDYFIEYRLDRDRTRSRQIELLQSIVNNPNSSDNERQEAQKKILSITNTLEQELKLESIIKAKGYEDAALFIQPTTVVVIVKGQNFDHTDATIIGDLVAKTTGHSLDQITIVPKA